MRSCGDHVQHDMPWSPLFGVSAIIRTTLLVIILLRVTLMAPMKGTMNDEALGNESIEARKTIIGETACGGIVKR